MVSPKKRTFVHICGAIAPYTHRLFEAVAEGSDLDFHVLNCTGREPHRQWDIPAPRFYTRKELSGLRLHLSDISNIYFNPSVLLDLWRLRPAAISVGGLSPTMLLAALYAMITRTPWCVGLDGTLETDPGTHSRVHRWIRKFFVPRATAGIAAGKGTVELMTHYGLPTSRCFTVPITPAWDGPSRIPSYEERPFDVLYCGAINEIKGADFFVSVLKRCKEKGKTIRVRIVGHGPFEDELASELDNMSIDAQFDGYLQADGLREAFTSAKIFIFPTRLDAWGLVVNEAILCGTPILASPHAAASKELVERYNAGRVVPLDVESWSNTLIMMLEDRKNWREMQATHAVARRWFSIRNVVAAFRSVLKAVEAPSTTVTRPKVARKIPSTVVSGSLKALHATGVHNLFAPHYRGLGAIFMLHRVNPMEPPLGSFAPHHYLSVTPDYLRHVIRTVRSLGYDTISLDEAADRIVQGGARPFVVFTLDDGYRDNLVHAYPVFKAEKVPFAIYVPSAWPTGEGELWWRAIEDVVAKAVVIEPCLEGLPAALPASTVAEKKSAFAAIEHAVNTMTPDQAYEFVRAISGRYGIDMSAICRDEIMSWKEISELANDPLVTIGAHTRTHASCARLDDATLRAEVALSRQEIEEHLGKPCRHFAFPYGGVRDAGPREFAAATEAGYLTAVTTRRGLVYKEHAQHLAALPRIALDGYMRDVSCIEVQLSGAPFALRNGLRHQVA